MLMYVEVFYRDDRNRQMEKITILVERRRDQNRQNGLKWVKIFFGGLVQDSHSIFVKPKKAEVAIE